MYQKHINIFLSSTFQDMQAERDYLKKNVLPELQDELYQYGITVSMTDLRWGVDTTSEDESLREAKVLHVCLDAIKRDRPYFIGIIGERYGWIPPADRIEQIIAMMEEDDKSLLEKWNEHSVTELEILFGALGSSDVLPHSFFFFRNPDVYETIPENLRSRYVEANDGLNGKLKSLCGHIIDVCKQNGLDQSVQYYDAEWDDNVKCLSGLKDFGRKVYTALLNDILESNGREAYVSQDEYEQRSFEAFVTQRLDGFCGRKDIVSFLENFCLDFNPLDINRVNGYFLSGNSGSGKSSVFCKIYSDLSSIQEKYKLILLGHAAGVTEDSCYPEKMLLKWVKKLESIPELSSASVPNSELDIISKFNNFLIRAICSGYKPVILIDSFDSFKFELQWMYSSEARAYKSFSFIPYNVPVVCTTLPSFVDEIIKDRESFKLIELKSFDKDEALELINHTLNVKELPQRMIDMIISKKKDDGSSAYSSPLWLRMALAILDEIGDKDFQKINQEKFERDDLKIASYLEKLIQGFAPDVAGLFEQYIDLSCDYFSPELVKTTLLFAAISGSGISEQDIEYMCPSVWNELEFASFARWMRSFFRQNPISGRWILGHNILKDVMQTHDIEMSSIMREKFIDILLNQDIEESDSSVLELLHQIILNQDFDLFLKFYYNWEQIFNRNFAEKIAEVTVNSLDKETVGRFFVSAIEKYLTDADKCEDIILIMDNWFDFLYGTGEDDSNFKKSILKEALSYFNQEILYSDRYIFRNWMVLFFDLKKAGNDDELEALFPKFLRICLENKDHLIKLGYYTYSCYFFLVLFNYAQIPSRKWGLYGGWMANEEKSKLNEEGTRRWLKVISIVKDFLSFENDGKYISDTITRITESFYEYFYSADEWKALNAAVDTLKASCKTEAEPEVETCKAEPEIEVSEPEEETEHQAFEKSQQNDEESVPLENEKPACKLVDAVLSPLDQSRQMLEQFLSTKIKNSSDDDYNELSELYINLANELVAIGKDDEALKIIDLCAGVCMSQYVFLPYIMKQEDKVKRRTAYDSYCLGEQRFLPLYNIAYWYISVNHVDKAISFLEKAYHNSKLWLAFFTDCDPVRYLISHLKKILCETGNTKRAAGIFGEYMEFMLRNPLLLSDRSPAYDIDVYINLLRSAGMDKIAEETLSHYKVWDTERKFEVLDRVGEYTEIRRYRNGYSAVAIPGLYHYCYIWGYTTPDGRVLVQPKYNEAGYFSEGLAMVGMGEGDRRLKFGVIGMKYGYIDINGKEVIPLEYDYASAFYKGEALVAKDDEFFYIDTSGHKTRAFEII